MMQLLRYVRNHLLAVVVYTFFLMIGAIFPFYSGVFQAKSTKFELSFIPKNHNNICEEITPNISMSPLYEETKLEFEQAVKNSTVTETIEGNSGEIDDQYKTMHYLAGQGHVKTICETGFNLGHSSFNYLTANDQLIVHSFDLGRHTYAYKMSEYMKTKFPDRFFIHFGDSTVTIPKFIRENPAFRCDFIFIDGGHVYPVALADIRNLAMIANLDENIILFDDYPTLWGKTFGKAWDDAIRERVIEEKMRCMFTKKIDRGFTIGRVLKRPN